MTAAHDRGRYRRLFIVGKDGQVARREAACVVQPSKHIKRVIAITIRAVYRAADLSEQCRIGEDIQTDLWSPRDFSHRAFGATLPAPYDLRERGIRRDEIYRNCCGAIREL